MGSKKQDDERPKLERGALMTVGRAIRATVPIDEGEIPDDLRKLVDRLEEREAKQRR